jgi:hypothetical protein
MAIVWAPAILALNITLCFPLSTFERDELGEPTGLLWNGAAQEAAALILAVDDINSANCALVGEGCDRKIAVGGAVPQSVLRCAL